MAGEWVTTTVRAYNKEGYQRDILVVDQQQVRMSDTRVEGGLHGSVITPSDFPEMVKFEIIITIQPKR